MHLRERRCRLSTSPEVWTAVGTVLITFLVGWGMIRKTVSNLEKAVDSANTENEALKTSLALTRERFMTDIADLSEKYVSFTHFNDFMQSFKETQRDLKEDVKRIYDLLSGNRSGKV